jgi:hypothetical protein
MDLYEPSISMQGVEFFDQLSSYQLLKGLYVMNSWLAARSNNRMDKTKQRGASQFVLFSW